MTYHRPRGWLRCCGVVCCLLLSSRLSAFVFVVLSWLCACRAGVLSVACLRVDGELCCAALHWLSHQVPASLRVVVGRQASTSCAESEGERACGLWLLAVVWCDCVAVACGGMHAGGGCRWW